MTYADAIVRVTEGHFMDGNLKDERSAQSRGRQEWTGRGRADPTEPVTLQTSMQR